MKLLPIIEKSLVIFLLLFVSLILYSLLDPFKILAAHRNERRLADVNVIADQIMVAVNTSTISAIPMGIDVNEQQIGAAAEGCKIENQLCSVITNNCTNIHYLAALKATLPSDILSGNIQRTGYSVMVNPDGELVVKSCQSEGAERIEVRRALPASGSAVLFKKKSEIQ